MRALSIRQPWAWAILHAGKRVENRAWERGPQFMVGQTFLLHAAKGCTVDEFDNALEFIIDASGSIACPPLHDMPRGAIVGRAKLVGIVRTTPERHRYRPTENHTCVLCGEAGVLRRQPPPPCPRADPWGIPGALGLLLADVEAIDAPIPFKGALGFFEVPDALLSGSTWQAVGQ